MKSYPQTSLFVLIICFVVLSSCSKNDNSPKDLVTQYELDKTIVQVNTTNVATGLQAVFDAMTSDSIGKASISQVFVDSARFFNDNSGYFFIETYNADVVAIVDHSLIGTNRMNIQDIYGKYFIQELVNTAMNIGYGFVEYYRENPTTNGIERKLSFVMGMPSISWFIGAGFYGDPPKTYYLKNNANRIIVQETTKTIAKGLGNVFSELYPDESDQISFCRNFINYIRFFDDQSGYFFIYNFDGINIAHGIQKDLEGENLWDYTDSKGNYVIQDLIEVAENDGEGITRYYWNNPVSGNEEPKIAYSVRIPGTNYLIGSGIYQE